MKKIVVISISVVAIILLGLGLSHHGLYESSKLKLFLMDTLVEVKAYGPGDTSAKAVEAGAGELRRIDKRFGYHDSIVSRLNTYHKVRDAELYRLMEKGLDVSRMSDGAFSIALAPMLKAWGFIDNRKYGVPGQKVFRLWKISVRDAGIHLMPDGITVCTDKATGVEIGGLAKGYAVDRACSIMRGYGIKGGIINAGGDIMAFGSRKWRIGLKDPRGPGVIAVIPVKNKAVATSGDYERYFIKNGRRYCHILNPRTGWPATRYMSVTILADKCIDADAWATAVFVMGLDKARNILKSRGMSWITIDRSGKIDSSDNLRRFCPSRIIIDIDN